MYNGIECMKTKVFLGRLIRMQMANFATMTRLAI